jgi:hypothetical protein
MSENKASVNQTDLISDKPKKKPWSAPELNSLTRRNTEGKSAGVNAAESGGGGNYPNYGPS